MQIEALACVGRARNERRSLIRGGRAFYTTSTLPDHRTGARIFLMLCSANHGSRSKIKVVLGREDGKKCLLYFRTVENLHLHALDRRVVLYWLSDLPQGRAAVAVGQ